MNPEHESIQENARVQESLEKAKVVRKRVVRYVQVGEPGTSVQVVAEYSQACRE